MAIYNDVIKAISLFPNPTTSQSNKKADINLLVQYTLFTTTMESWFYWENQIHKTQLLN